MNLKELKELAERADAIVFVKTCVDGNNEARDMFLALLADRQQLRLALQYLVHGEPKDGDNERACTFCDMGGAGYSSKGDGHHDDTRDICPVFKARAALEASEKLEK